MVINSLVHPPSLEALTCNEATLLALDRFGCNEMCNSFRLHGGNNEYAEAKLVCLLHHLEGH
jgi:hypothetical protein